LEIFYFAPVEFECTAKDIFIPKDLKLNEISTKKHFKFLKKKFKEWAQWVVCDWPKNASQTVNSAVVYEYCAQHQFLVKRAQNDFVDVVINTLH